MVIALSLDAETLVGTKNKVIVDLLGEITI